MEQESAACGRQEHRKMQPLPGHMPYESRERKGEDRRHQDGERVVCRFTSMMTFLQCAENGVVLAIYKQDALAGLCRVVNQVATSGPLKNITERRFNGNIVWCQCTSRLIAITVIQHRACSYLRSTTPGEVSSVPYEQRLCFPGRSIFSSKFSIAK